MAGPDKVKASRVLGERPVFAWLPLDRLVVDERYQRRIGKDGLGAIGRMAKTFAWSKCQPLTVTGPDASGDYPVIDGQHRLEAMRRHPMIDEAPCWIVPAPHIADQAGTFIAVNKDRIGVTRVAVFWAALAAGNPDAAWIKSICDRAGIAVGRAGTGIQPALTTIALASLLKLRPLGDAVLVRSLSLLARSQAEAPNAFRAPVVVALTRLIGMADQLDEERLVAALADTDLDDLIEKARTGRRAFGGKTEDALMTILARLYNKGLREDRRLPERKAA